MLQRQVRGMLVCLAVAYIGVCPTASSASPVSVNAGESVIFNFDFIAAGTSPAPPYGTMDFVTGTVTSTVEPGDAGFWTFFAEPYGVAPLFTAALNTGGAGFGGGPGGGVANDGIFSASLTMTAGSITVDPFARGINWLPSNIGELFFTPNVYPALANQVPEANSLALAGLAIILLYLTYGRRGPCASPPLMHRFLTRLPQEWQARRDRNGAQLDQPHLACQAHRLGEQFGELSQMQRPERPGPL